MSKETPGWKQQEANQTILVVVLIIAIHVVHCPFRSQWGEVFELGRAAGRDQELNIGQRGAREEPGGTVQVQL